MRVLLLLLVISLRSIAADLAGAIPATSRQVVCVTAPDWTASRGRLRRFERAKGGEWREVGAGCEVLLGERGLAWGIGRHDAARTSDRRKREGDRRAPAGIFALTGVFGRVPAGAFEGLAMPYRQLTPDTEAVDDPESRFYNRIVRRRDVRQPEWKSAERMHALPDYALGVVVAHNPGNRPGAGSCIFIHEWRGDRRGTAGCTVLRAPDLRDLVRWLEAAKRPLLLQLPGAEMPRAFR